MAACIGTVALLTIREVFKRMFDTTQLRSVFGLTPAEAELASILAMGKPMREAAEMRGVSYETARFHAKAIYSKVGSNNQVELMFILNRLFQ